MNLYEKLQAIQAKQIGIKKENDVMGRFKTYKKEEIIALIKPLLTEYKIGYIYNSSATQIETVDNFYINNIQIQIYDAERPEEKISFSDFIAVEKQPSRGNSLGQFKGASDTYIWKYMLANIFNIPTSEKDLDTLMNKQESQIVKANKKAQNKTAQQYLNYLKKQGDESIQLIVNGNNEGLKTGKELIDRTQETLNLNNVKYKTFKEFNND